MDTADDIAYAIHDLEDFHRVGVLQQAGVAAELNGWQRRRPRTSRGEAGPGSATWSGCAGGCAARTAGSFDDDTFAAAVDRVRDELVDGLLAAPFDGSMAAERAVAEFSARWTARLVGRSGCCAEPPVRAAHVRWAPEQWHEVAVLKFVHHRFVLQRADLACTSAARPPC